MVTLKKFLAEAGALIGDRMMGFDTLYDVLKAAVQNSSGQLTAYQATIATATLASVLANGAGKITGLRTNVAVCGSAGSTTVQVQKNGSSVGELTTANTETDPTKKSLALDVSYADGDLIQLVVTAAPTGGTGLTVTAQLQPLAVE